MSLKPFHLEKLALHSHKEPQLEKGLKPYVDIFSQYLLLRNRYEMGDPVYVSGSFSDGPN